MCTLEGSAWPGGPQSPTPASARATPAAPTRTDVRLAVSAASLLAGVRLGLQRDEHAARRPMMAVGCRNSFQDTYLARIRDSGATQAALDKDPRRSIVIDGEGEGAGGWAAWWSPSSFKAAACMLECVALCATYRCRWQELHLLLVSGVTRWWPERQCAAALLPAPSRAERAARRVVACSAQLGGLRQAAHGVCHGGGGQVEGARPCCDEWRSRRGPSARLPAGHCASGRRGEAGWDRGPQHPQHNEGSACSAARHAGAGSNAAVALRLQVCHDNFTHGPKYTQ